MLKVLGRARAHIMEGMDGRMGGCLRTLQGQALMSCVGCENKLQPVGLSTVVTALPILTGQVTEALAKSTFSARTYQVAQHSLSQRLQPSDQIAGKRKPALLLAGTVTVQGPVL